MHFVCTNLQVPLGNADFCHVFPACGRYLPAHAVIMETMITICGRGRQNCFHLRTISAINIDLLYGTTEIGFSNPH